MVVREAVRRRWCSIVRWPKLMMEMDYSGRNQWWRWCACMCGPHIGHLCGSGAPSSDLVSCISLFKKNYYSNRTCWRQYARYFCGTTAMGQARSSLLYNHSSNGILVICHLTIAIVILVICHWPLLQWIIVVMEWIRSPKLYQTAPQMVHDLIQVFMKSLQTFSVTLTMSSRYISQGKFGVSIYFFACNHLLVAMKFHKWLTQDQSFVLVHIPYPSLQCFWFLGHLRQIFIL
jgi:hypothetical protein